MDATTAWDLCITGFTDSGHAQRHATRVRAGPLEAVRLAAGELNGMPLCGVLRAELRPGRSPCRHLAVDDPERS
jgi:hypothetical protein